MDLYINETNLYHRMGLLLISIIVGIIDRPEPMAFAPLGIGVVPYEVPGSMELAKATLDKIHMCCRNMGSVPTGMTPEAMKDVQTIFHLPTQRPC